MAGEDGESEGAARELLRPRRLYGVEFPLALFGSHETLRWREMGIRTLGPPSAATPSATANHLSSHHLPRQLGLRFAPKASTPSRKSSDLRRPVFKIEPKPRRQLHDPLLPAKRRTGQVVLGIDRFTSHAAQMDLPRSGPEEVFPRHRGEGRLDPRVPDAKCHFLRQA